MHGVCAWPLWCVALKRSFGHVTMRFLKCIKARREKKVSLSFSFPVSRGLKRIVRSSRDETVKITLDTCDCQRCDRSLAFLPDCGIRFTLGFFFVLLLFPRCFVSLLLPELEALATSARESCYFAVREMRASCGVKQKVVHSSKGKDSHTKATRTRAHVHVH